MVDFIRNHYIRSYEKHKTEIDLAIENCICNGKFILQEDVELFEKNFAQLHQAKYCVGVGSGTDALILALKALGIKQGDEVITSGHTFWATIEAIIHCGATPIIVDIFENGTIDTDLERYINAKTKAIIPVHISGIQCEMKQIMELAEEYSLKVIEDSAQAVTTPLLGDAACFSFYPAKILGCYGDGGAVVTNNDSIDTTVRLLRNHGGKPIPLKVGYSSRLDNIQAAILNVKMKYLQETLRRRREVAIMYNKAFYQYTDSQYGEIKMFLSPLREIYQDYIIKVGKRNKLYDFLKEKEIETIKDEYPFMEGYPKLPVAISWESQALRLPCNDQITDEEVNYVIQSVKEFEK